MNIGLRCSLFHKKVKLHYSKDLPNIASSDSYVDVLVAVAVLLSKINEIIPHKLII